jgi:hypothetical protein
MFIKHLNKLNSKGIAHVIVPMLVIVGVGIAGAGAMVATHAASKKAPTGYLVVYSNGFTYQKVNINIVGQSGKGKFCGSTFDSKGFATKDLTSAHYSNDIVRPTRFRCSATSGTGKYDITYINVAGGAPNVTVAVDVNANQCTIVHPNAALTALRDFKNGKCQSLPDDEDKAPIIPALIKVLPNPNKKAFSGYVAVVSDTTDLKKFQCTGSIKVTVTPTAAGSSSSSYDFPLKFVGKKTGGPHDYCVATLTMPKTVSYTAGEYLIAAQLSGSKFFTAAPASAKVTLVSHAAVSSPATSASTKPTTKTTQPASGSKPTVTVTEPQ